MALRILLPVLMCLTVPVGMSRNQSKPGYEVLTKYGKRHFLMDLNPGPQISQFATSRKESTLISKSSLNSAEPFATFRPTSSSTKTIPFPKKTDTTPNAAFHPSVSMNMMKVSSPLLTVFKNNHMNSTELVPENKAPVALNYSPVVEHTVADVPDESFGTVARNGDSIGFDRSSGGTDAHSEEEVVGDFTRNAVYNTSRTTVEMGGIVPSSTDDELFFPGSHAIPPWAEILIITLAVLASSFVLFFGFFAVTHKISMIRRSRADEFYATVYKTGISKRPSPESQIDDDDNDNIELEPIDETVSGGENPIIPLEDLEKPLARPEQAPERVLHFLSPTSSASERMLGSHEGKNAASEVSGGTDDTPRSTRSLSVRMDLEDEEVIQGDWSESDNAQESCFRNVRFKMD